MPDEDTSSVGKLCPLLKAWCGPLVTISGDGQAMHHIPCAFWDSALETCCLRAINDHLRSMYGGCK